MWTLIDGPLGTELLARGVPTPVPGWSAHALETAPDVVAAIHADYARAGASVHTANTFRTKARVFPERWEAMARRAVELARASVPATHRIAGSIAPLEDCYEPELSPAETDEATTHREHRELAVVLADAGCDLLLCETFPHVGEGLIAVEEAVGTGVETWASFTPGYRADLLSPDALAQAALQAVERGASAVLVNCVSAQRMLDYLLCLGGALGETVPWGGYANAGRPEDRMGWESAPQAAERYAELASQWHEAGARLIGGCCGTGPAHTAAMRRQLPRR
jgi:S-methylmethionine-dependent homocysteine/selenocysteine methylase